MKGASLGIGGGKEGGTEWKGHGRDKLIKDPTARVATIKKGQPHKGGIGGIHPPI